MRILIGLLYPASAFAFAAMCIWSARAHWLVNLGLLVVSCFCTYTYMRLLAFAIGLHRRMRQTNQLQPQYRHDLREHLAEHHPELPDESERRRGMWQLAAIGITSSLAFLLSTLVLICRILENLLG